MIILTTLDLRPYIGQRIVLNEIQVQRRSRRQRIHRGRVALQNQHGLWNGPIFVLREVTREDYVAEKAAEIGRPLTPKEQIATRQYRLKFFDISVD